MILIEKTEVLGLEHSIRGMRNPRNSWDKSDSGLSCPYGEYKMGVERCTDCVKENCRETPYLAIGINDRNLMKKLANAGPVHGKYRRMITVYLDITAPLYWWKEFDTYKVGAVANSCSSMYDLKVKEFKIDDFSHDQLLESTMTTMTALIDVLNACREAFLATNNKALWYQMIQLLPSSYNQKRTIMLNYEVLAGIYSMRKDHKLDEWSVFCRWIEWLPYSDVITG